jgi:isochorismate synthase
LNALKAPAASAKTSLCAQFDEHTPFFLSSPRQSLLARPEQVAQTLLWEADAQLASRCERAQRELAEREGAAPWIVGALPFDGERAPATLYLLRDVARECDSNASELRATPRGLLMSMSGYHVAQRPTPRAFVAGVEQALTRIARGELSKVVLSRCLELQLDEPVSCRDVLRELSAQNPRGYTFALRLADGPQPCHLLGASPELLLEKRQGKVFTTPHAGSRPRCARREDDERMGRELLASSKDRREHDLLVDAVVEALRPWCKQLDVPSGPSLISTPTMWHLATPLSGELRDPDCSSLALAQALHPTPAVCGLPLPAARQAIRELEDFERGLFAGAVGYCDARGDGEWAVTLRCAELASNSLRLFAGAGVVEGSEPWSEFDETAAKFGTMLRALGIGLVQGAS